MSLLQDVGNFLFGWLVPDTPTPQDPGVELVPFQTNAYLPKIYGQVKKHTPLGVFKATNDFDNDDQENDTLFIIVVWGHSVRSIDEVYLDDVPISADSDLFFYDNFDGQQGTRVRTTHVRNFPNGMAGYDYSALTATGWSSNDNLAGCACTFIQMQYVGDPDASTLRQEPIITADITGSIFANPMQALNSYLTGTEWGKGLSSDDIDLAALAAEQSYCNDLVPVFDGSVDDRTRFTINYAMDNEQTVLGNVNKILRSCRGLLPVLNGKLKPIIEKDDPAVSVEIIERDIIKLGPISDNGKNERYNQVIVEYRDADADGTLQDAIYPEQDSALHQQYLDEDNGVDRSTNVELHTCNNYYEALAFGKTLIDVSRQGQRASITLPLWATLYEVGDIVTVSHSRPGWDQKDFRIERTSESEDEVTLFVREHQPLAYQEPGDIPKPEIPDTNITYTAPNTPTNLLVELFNEELRQARITWSGDTTRYDYQVLNLDNDLLEEGRIARKYIEISGLSAGTYTVKVRAVKSFRVSGWIEIDVVLQVPGVPTAMLVDASNFEAIISPTLAGADRSVEFEVFVTDDSTPPSDSNVKGPAHVITWTGLAPDALHTVYARSVNALGKSAFASTTFTTTNDDAGLNVVISQNLATEIFDDVVTEVNSGLTATVNNIVSNRPTFTQVNASIDSAIVQVNAALDIDPDQLGRNILDLYSDFNRQQDIKNESQERNTQVTALTASTDENSAQIIDVQQAVTTESEARATDIAGLRAEITGPSGDTAAQILEYNEVLVGPSGAIAQQILSFQNSYVDANFVSNTSISQNYYTQSQTDLAIAQESTALRATIDGDISAAIDTNNTALVSPTGAITLATQNLKAELEGASGSITAASNAAAAAQVTANGAASAATSVTNTVNDPANGLTAVAQRADAAQLTADGNTSSISIIENRIDDSSTGLSALSSQISDVQNDADGNASAINSVITQINNGTTRLDALSTRITAAQQDADGNTTAINALSSEINNETTGLSAIGTIATQAQIDADNNSQSISTISNVVNDPATGNTALAGLINTAQTTADGNTTAISSLQTRVSNAEGDISSAQVSIQAVETDVGEIKSEVLLAVNAGGNLAFFQLDGTPTQTVINLQSDLVNYLDGNGAAWIEFDSQTQEARFLGTLAAGKEILSPLITGGTFRTASSGFRTEVSADGDFPIWVGDDTKNEANAKFFIKNDGTGFIAGEFFQGQIQRNRSASSNTRTVTATDHTSAGNDVSVDATLRYDYSYTQTTQPGFEPRTLSYTIKRNGTTIDSGTFRVVRTVEFDAENNIYWIYEYYTATFSDTDTGTADGVTYSYEFQVSNVVGADYRTTIKTFEALI